MSQRISVHELKERLAADPSLILIDVRTPAEFEAVHVPSTRNLPLNELTEQALVAHASPTQTIYLFCHSGRRAVVAAEQLASTGQRETIVIAGGTEAWLKEGLPVTRGEVKTISLERQVRIGAGSLVLLGLALGWTVHHYFLGISAFVGAGLVFAGITDWCGMGLLLAKAPWNQRKKA